MIFLCLYLCCFAPRIYSGSRVCSLPYFCPSLAYSFTCSMIRYGSRTPAYLGILLAFMSTISLLVVDSRLVSSGVYAVSRDSVAVVRHYIWFVDSLVRSVRCLSCVFLLFLCVLSYLCCCLFSVMFCFVTA